MKKTILSITLLLVIKFSFCQKDVLGGNFINFSNINKILSESSNINDFNQKVNVITLSRNGDMKVLIQINDSYQRIISTEKFIAIFETNVELYFDFVNEKTSLLEKKVIHDSLVANNIYPKYLDSLIQIKQKIINTPTLVSTKLDPCLFKYKYSLEKEAFPFENVLLVERFFDKKYLQIGSQFESICIVKPQNFTFEEGFAQNGNGYYIQRTFLPVSPASSALKIEKNCNNSELYFVIKLTDLKKKKHSHGFNMSFIISEAKSYFIIDSSNGEIIHKKLL